MQTSEIFDAALDYSKLGWAILPIRSASKIPLTPHGVRDASGDETVILDWFTQFPNANIAIATGAPSDIWVLDLDGKEGVDAFKRLEAQFGPIPPTPRAKTGDGEHLFFRCSAAEAKELKNTARLNGLPIDVRATGGYVVAPPSRHQNGRAYQWVLSPATVSPIAAPEWLMTMVKHRRRPTASHQDHAPLRLHVQVDADLKTAPGVGEGKRNNELCRLIGGHLRCEDPTPVIEALALAWSQRCNPPLPAEEVLNTVHSLATKHIAASTSPPATNLPTQLPADEVESIPLPDPPEWPQLDSSAYHGLAGEIVNAIAPHSEADPVALLIQLLAFAANAIGRTPYYIVEGDRHHACLFACIVGQSARGRKGTAKGRVGQVIKESDPLWYEDRVVSGLSSGEGLIHAVRDPVVEQEEVKEKGRVIAVHDVVKDPGGGDRRLMVIEPEFGRVMRVMRREGNPLSPVIRQFWDSGDARTLTKNTPLKATGAHLSIIAHVTIPELERQLDATSIFDGFANRFVWAIVKRSKLLPDGGALVDLSSCTAQMRETIAVANQIEQMQRSPAARQLWHDVYPELTAEKPSVIHDAVTSRAEAQTLRLSMVYALLDRTNIIDVPHLQAALALWRYCDDSAKLIFAQAETEDPLAQKIREALQHAADGLTRTEIHHITGRNHPAKLLVAKLAKMRDRGLIECRRPESGKPGPNPERWYIKKRPKAEAKTRDNSSYHSYSSSGLNIKGSEAKVSGPQETAPPDESAETAAAIADETPVEVDDEEFKALLQKLSPTDDD